MLIRGIDFIICDHHLPGEEIPNAAAVLDPKKEATAVSVQRTLRMWSEFKLCQGLNTIYKIPEAELFKTYGPAYDFHCGEYCFYDRVRTRRCLPMGLKSQKNPEHGIKIINSRIKLSHFEISKILSLKLLENQRRRKNFHGKGCCGTMVSDNPETCQPDL